MRRTNIILIAPVLLSLSLSPCAFSKGMHEPIDRLNEPVSRLDKPVLRVNNQLDNLKKDLSELKEVVHVTSTLILCAIVGVGVFVAVGTPIGVVIAWRYRNNILNKVDQLATGHDPDAAPTHPHTPVGPVKSTR